MKRPSRKRFNATRMLLGALACIALALPALAEEAGSQAEPKQQNVTSVFMPPDRELTALLNRARQLQQQERYADAVRCLGRVLESAEDYLCPPQELGLPPQSAHESLKGYAQRLLGQMPQQGLESYELQFGARAKQLLSTGVENSDIDAIAEVSRRFFHTRAGYEATLLLALHYLEHGSPLAAAVTLEKLRPKEGPSAARMSAIAEQFEPGLSLTLAACWTRCGQRSKAEAALRSLAEKHPRVRVGGREMGLSGDLRAVLKSLEGQSVGAFDLNQWAMYGGNPARNASSAGGAPLLSLCWRQSTTEDPHIEGLLGQIETSFHEQDRWVVPTVHPLAVNDMVLMRTTKNLLAVNFITGKRVWEVPTDDPFESALDPAADVNYGGRQSVDFSSGLRYRMWGDATFGTLSSDGRFVFAVEDLPLEVGTSWAARHMVFINRRNNPAQARPFNRLAAYDIESGKLVWHAGGSPEEQSLPLAGSFFLGPPLPFGGQLYVLAETKGEIRLIALNYDDRSVKAAWSQQLTYVDTDENVLFDPIRRLSGASPSYADGVLVCPTSNNSVVALDLANRSLLWGYQYRKTPLAEQQRVGRQTQMEAEPGSRWADAAVRIADSRVLITPVDSQYSHCLDLMTGKLLWKEPRGDDLFVACVAQGAAVFAGRSGVHAFRLERRKDADITAQAAKLPQKPLAEEDDGIELQSADESDAGEARAAPAWDGRLVEYPNGGHPTGTGFLSEGLYYLPMSTAEVIAIDVAQGRVAHVYKSRRGFVPGNLVCHNGRILSQRADGLEVFYQRDALRKRVEERLAANPKDPEALAQRGEIAWDEGDLKGAVACFRDSLELSDNPNARTLLRESLFEGLRTDFASYRGNSEEVLRLIEEPRQQAAYLRLMAAGHENLSEYGQALDFYVKLIDLEGNESELESVAKAQSVRRDRWVRVQLAALRQVAPPEIGKRIDDLAAKRLEAATSQTSPESLVRYLNYFGDLPTAVTARRALASRLREQGRLLHAELVLRHLERSSDPSQAGAALAELAAVLTEAKLYGDAAICYARLQREFGDVACLDGRTGRQIVQSLPADGPVAAALKPNPAWPSKHVAVEKGPAQERRNLAYSGTTSVAMVGRPSPFYEELSLEWNMSPATLTARDGWGQPRWQVSMADAARRGYSYGPNYWRAASQDHLLLVLMDNKLVALDTLTAGQKGAPRVLWTHELDESGSDGSRRRPPQFLNPAFAAGRTAPGSAGEFPTNVPSAITEQLICYQRFQHLYGIDPISGDVVWQREDVRPDSVIFGDDRRIFVVPPDNSPAAVLRSADGKLLGKRELPSPTERLAPCGRHLLVWRNEGDKMLLELFDPWEKKSVWPAKPFDVESRVSVIDGELAAVFELSSGRFHLFDIADGRSLIDARLDPEKTLSEIYLIRSPENFVLVLNGLERPEEPQTRSHYYGFYGVPVRQITRARLYSFDRNGKKTWRKPVTIEDQYLIMNQPVRLPVLLFARGVQATGPGNQARLALLAVDKRNGQLHNPEESLQGHGYFRVAGDPEKKAIELHLYQEVITMTFTDRSPDPPGTAEALLRAIRRTVEGGSRLPPIPMDMDDP